jgi:hypothetical protein
MSSRRLHDRVAQLGLRDILEPGCNERAKYHESSVDDSNFQSLDDIFNLATKLDEALYQVKKRGHNTTSLFLIR